MNIHSPSGAKSSDAGRAHQELRKCMAPYDHDTAVKAIIAWAFDALHDAAVDGMANRIGRIPHDRARAAWGDDE